jgi:t-SNARE complex subunit (syntaxin)
MANKNDTEAAQSTGPSIDFAERARVTKCRNYILLGVLFAWVALIYVVSMVKMSGN